MFTRINILKIVTDHFKTLNSVDSSTKTMTLYDIILFLLFPLSISIYLVFKGYTFNEQLGNLIAGISIFGGFLFNLLAIIYSQLENIENNNKNQNDSLYDLKKRFVNEIHINISFCIVLSIFIVIGLFLSTIDFPIKNLNFIFNKIIIGIDYFLLLLFSLSLLMVINRVYILLKRK
jgi:hypothetical protein